MVCKRSMTVMGTGTIFEQKKGQERASMKSRKDDHAEI